MITGINALTRQLDEFGKAAKALDGDIATVNFDPNEASSVRAAIREMERAVDSKVSRWRTNPLVVNLASQTKASMRDAIRKRAHQALVSD